MVRRVEPGAPVTRSERLKHPLDLLTGRRAADEAIRGDPLLDLEGPVDRIHAAVTGGERRVWLLAQKKGSYRHVVSIMGWMFPEWEEEGNEDRFLCLEFPDGFQGPVMIRKDDAALAEGDDRPLGKEEESQMWRWLRAMTDIVRRR